MKHVWFLHGFLGRPEDGFFLKDLQGVRLHCVDYLNEKSLQPHLDFKTWGENFVEYVQLHSLPGEQHILFGYSLGGRLAAHAFLHKPSLFRSLILAATHLGLESIQDRETRKESDKTWAKMFLQQEWSSLMEAWFAQEVFIGQKEVHRREVHYDRQVLAQVFTRWSLAEQEPLALRFQNSSWSLNYLVGSEDQKFLRLADQYKDNGFPVRVIARA